MDENIDSTEQRLRVVFVNTPPEFPKLLASGELTLSGVTVSVVGNTISVIYAAGPNLSSMAWLPSVS
jgi:hypothetical protein